MINSNQRYGSAQLILTKNLVVTSVNQAAAEKFPYFKVKRSIKSRITPKIARCIEDRISMELSSTVVLRDDLGFYSMHISCKGEELCALLSRSVPFTEFVSGALSSMSDPLLIIRNCTELLYKKADTLPPDVLELVNMLRRSSVRSMSALASMSATLGEGSPNSSSCDLSSVCDMVAEAVMIEVNAAGLDFKLDTGKFILAAIDGLALEKVVASLILYMAKKAEKVMSLVAYTDGRTPCIKLYADGALMQSTTGKLKFSPWIIEGDTTAAKCDMELVTAESIIERSGGQFSFKEEDGGGAFYIRLKAASAGSFEASGTPIRSLSKYSHSVEAAEALRRNPNLK